MAVQVKGTNGNPGTIYDSFSLADMELSYNATVHQLRGNFNAQRAIASHLNDMGLTRFVNLTHKTDDSRIALAMYAGDGIVVKVIPTNYMGAPNAIYHLPSITKNLVTSGDESFYVKTYPWVAGGYVSENDIAKFKKEQLEPVGMSITDGDDTTRNIHRMPDKKGTMVGIDSAMFRVTPGAISSELEKQWHRYVHTLFPIYDEASVRPQTRETDFSYLSLHDREVGNSAWFDSQRGEIAFTERPAPHDGSLRQIFVDLAGLFRKGKTSPTVKPVPGGSEPALP